MRKRLRKYRARLVSRGLFSEILEESIRRKRGGTFLIADAPFLGGCIGVELIGGSLAVIHGKDKLTYIAFTTIEESLECAETVVFIRALLGYIAENFREARIQFGGKI